MVRWTACSWSSAAFEVARRVRGGAGGAIHTTVGAAMERATSTGRCRHKCIAASRSEPTRLVSRSRATVSSAIAAAH